MLLLRIAIGVPAIYQGLVFLNNREASSVATLFGGLASLLGGASLILGLLTPFAGILVGGVAVGTILSDFPPINFKESMMPPIIAIVAIAVVCLGPGALSIDALLFGRREIIIPRPARRPDL